MSALRDIAHGPPTIPNLRLENQFLPGKVDQLRRYVQRLQNNTTPQGLRELWEDLYDLEREVRLHRRELQTLTHERDKFKRLDNKVFKKVREYRERKEKDRQALEKVKTEIYGLSYYLKDYRDQFGRLPGDYVHLYLDQRELWLVKSTLDFSG